MILFYGLGVVVALDSGRGERRSQTEPRATVGVRKTVVGSWVAAGDEASRRRGRSGEWYDPFRVELTMGGWGSVGALRGRKAMVLERFGLWNEGDWVHGRLRDRFGALPWVCQSPERERRACPRLRNTNRARPTPRSETNRTGQTPHHAPPTWAIRRVRDTSGGPRAGAWGSVGSGKRREPCRPGGRFEACAILRADPALALGALMVRAHAANRAAQADDSKRARYFGRTPRWRLGL